MNPFALSDTLPMVRDRSFDMNSPLGRKCRNPKTWKEDCPESPEGKNLMLSNAEMLNFIVVLHDGEFAGKPLIYDVALWRAQDRASAGWPYPR